MTDSITCKSLLQKRDELRETNSELRADIGESREELTRLDKSRSKLIQVNTDLKAERDRLRAALEAILPMVGAPHDYTIGDVWKAQEQAQSVLNEVAATGNTPGREPSEGQPEGGGSVGRLLEIAQMISDRAFVPDADHAAAWAQEIRNAAGLLKEMRDIIKDYLRCHFGIERGHLDNAARALLARLKETDDDHN